MKVSLSCSIILLIIWYIFGDYFKCESLPCKTSSVFQEEKMKNDFDVLAFLLLYSININCGKFR